MCQSRTDEIGRAPKQALTVDGAEDSGGFGRQLKHAIGGVQSRPQLPFSTTARRQEQAEVVSQAELAWGTYRGGEEGLLGGVWGEVQHGICGGFRGQRQRSQAVHDQVDPQHLDRAERALLQSHCSRDSCCHGHDVHDQLHGMRQDQAQQRAGVTALMYACTYGGTARRLGDMMLGHNAVVVGSEQLASGLAACAEQPVHL